MSTAAQARLTTFGLALCVFGGVLLWRTQDALVVKVSVGILATGLLLVVPSQLAASITLVGTALKPFVDLFRRTPP